MCVDDVMKLPLVSNQVSTNANIYLFEVIVFQKV